MTFILLWIFSMLTSIVNGVQCAAYFDYGQWNPMDFCMNQWDARGLRESIKVMCNAEKTNLTRIHWDDFGCTGPSSFNFTTKGGIIADMDPGSVLCQQDFPLCSVTNQVAVANAFTGLTQSQCDTNDFSGGPEFRQESSSFALDICFDYPPDHAYKPGDSRSFSCYMGDLEQNDWNSAGCIGVPDTIAVTSPTCVSVPTFDAVIQCGPSTNTLITWSLSDYPPNPTGSPTRSPIPYNWTYYNDTDTYTKSAAVAGLFAFFTFLCCCGMVCCFCSILLCCILRCFGDTEDDGGIAYKFTMGIYYIFWFLLILPFKACKFGCKKIFFCGGCSMDVAKRFFSFLPNLISTIIILSRFGSAQSGIDFEKAASEGVASLIGDIDPKIVQGLTIITFVLIGFIIKAKEFYVSYQTAKGLDSEIVKSLHIKNLQAVIITSSDTLFKMFAGLAIIVGSDYSGVDEDGDGESIVISYIKGAAIIGVIQEFIDMADEYLTQLIMFVPKAETSNEKFSCEFSAATIKDEVAGNISGKLTVDELEPGVPAQSTQKTILWNAMWAGTKLCLLLIEQLFCFIAACMLAADGDVVGFIVIVIICCLADIVLAAVMCTKYQKLSVGLFCKYYLCCLYDQCSSHCEKHWIKLDPVEKGLTFNTYGGVATQPAKPKQPEIAEKMGEHQELNTENAGKDATVYGDSGADGKNNKDEVGIDLVVAENQNNANDNYGDDNKNDADDADDAADQKNENDKGGVDENVDVKVDGDNDKGVVDENVDDVKVEGDNDKGDVDNDKGDVDNDKGDVDNDKGGVDENVDGVKVEGDNDKGDVDGNDKGDVDGNDKAGVNANDVAYGGDDNAQD